MAGYGYPGGGFNMPPSNSMFNFQPPTYNPLAGPGLLSNPMMQFAMAMYMPQMMGQGNFLPSLAPSQHLFDQYAASKYQNATMQGRKMVQGVDQQAIAGRILGMQSMFSDKPPTALNVEQAQNMAGIINDPLAKMFIGAVMGPQNMEDLFFGRRGSADMLYSSVAKTGFYKRDPATGGQRMSAGSLAGVSKEMYAQMYGPQADIGEMNGISAGRAGVMYEDLFRRGLLPQSLGNMSASDRVKAIAENRPRDEATMDRLSREFTTQKLMRDDKDFKGLTVEQQKRRVDENLSAGRAELEGQFREIEAYNAGRPGADGKRKSISEIEQLEGFGVAARSVDAKKASDTLKNYSGAVAAIREIFGENGNTNAPMQQLMAGLEALTQNSVGQMTPGKVEGFVRRAQMASRESGIGLEAMMGISSQLGAYGDTLGLNRMFAAENTVNAMNAVTAMRGSGKFEAAYGRMTPEQAAMQSGQRAQAADASRVGNSLAVAARFVGEDPNAFKGTEIEALVNAYNRGETTYDFNGETVDIVQQMGKYGSAYTGSLLQQAGVDQSQIDLYTMDKFGNQEFQKAGYARHMQRGNLQNIIGRNIRQYIPDGDSVDPRVRDEFSNRMAGVMFDDIDTSMSATERLDVMKTRSREILVDLENEKLAVERPDLSAAQRQAMAEKNANANFETFFGKTDTEVTRSFGKYNAIANRVAQDRTGRNMEQNRQMMDKEVGRTEVETDIVRQRRAELMSNFGGAQSNVLQRISDVIGSMGSGDKKTAQQAIDEVLSMVPTEQMEDAIRPGVGAIMQYAARQYKGAVVTTSADINKLHADAKRGDQNAVKQLQALAGDGADKITDVDELQRRAMKESAEKVREGGADAVKRVGAIYRGMEEGGTGIDRVGENIAQSLLGGKGAAGDVDAVTKALFGKDEKALRTLLAQKGVGAAEIDEAVKMSQGLVSMKENDISLGGSEEKMVARARKNTVGDIVTKDNEEQLMKTREGRRLVAMKNAKADGSYEYDYGDGKMVSGNVSQESSEEFRAAVDAGVRHADQKTKDAAAKAFDTADKKADQTKSDSAAAAGTAPKKEESRGLLGMAYDALMGTGGSGSAGAAAVAAAGVSAGKEIMSGGISSANITIQNLENLYVQNATGMNVPADVQKKVDDAAAGGAPKSADAVAAGVAAQRDKKKTDAVGFFDAALKQLGTVAENAGVPMRDLIDGANKIMGALTPEDKKAAEEAVDGANKAAQQVVAATDTAPKDPRRQRLESDVRYAQEQVDRASQAPDAKTRKQLMGLAEQRLQEAKGRLASYEEHGEGAAAASSVDQASRETKQEQRKQETAAEEKQSKDEVRTKDDLHANYSQNITEAEKQLDRAKKHTDPEIRADLERVAANSVDVAKNKLRAYEIAKASGIPWDSKKYQYKTVGNVPISINGRDVDPAALTEEELKNVIGATQVSAMMSGEPTHEEAARLKQYQEALTKKKAENTKQESQSASATSDVAGNVDNAAVKAAQVKQESAQVTGADKQRAGQLYTSDLEALEGAAQLPLGMQASTGKYSFDQSFLGPADDKGKRAVISRLGDQYYKKRESSFVDGAPKWDRVNIEEGDRQTKKDNAAADDRKAIDQKQDKKEAQEQQKQTEVSLVTPQPEERQDKQQEKTAMQSVQAVAQAEMQQRNINSGSGSGGSSTGGENETNITGTLQLRGLNEAFLAAKGKQLEETPDNGAPVDLANATAAYVGT